MAETYGFQYELVQYKWPRWLHQQTEKQRIIWGYKILFLDVLFPLAVDKIIFVDADQVSFKSNWHGLKVRDSSVSVPALVWRLDEISNRNLKLKCCQSSPYSPMFSPSQTDSSSWSKGVEGFRPGGCTVRLHTVLWQPQRNGRLSLLENWLLGLTSRTQEIPHQVHFLKSCEV